MKKNYSLFFLKNSILCLVFYNIFLLFTLYTNNIAWKSHFWAITPYDYKKITLSPNYFSNKSLLKKDNQNLILYFLNKNKQKNYLDVDFWNYKKTIESFDKKSRSEFENSFYSMFILAKNNPNQSLILKKFFISDYLNFSEKYRNLIIKNF